MYSFLKNRLLILAIMTPCLLPAAPLQRWIYASQNLWVDANVDALEALIDRGATAGYTHLLLADSKFSKLGDMDARYFKNIDRVKARAASRGMEIVPALFSIGYSNDLLWHDPNLIEGMPVRGEPLIIQNGIARADTRDAPELRGGDFSDLSQWNWKDDCVTADQGTARMQNPHGNARIVQKISLPPWRQYEFSVRVRSQDWKGMAEVKLLKGNTSLSYQYLGVAATQDWKTHRIWFNSQEGGEFNLYLGGWGVDTGILWWDDATLKPCPFYNLIRRPGAPMELVHADSGKPLGPEWKDRGFSDPGMGATPWKGEYTTPHAPPELHLDLPNGTRIHASYYHAVTVHDGQAMICPSEPKTRELLRDQARRMHAAWGAKGYMMSHDEIRVLNWCQACSRRNQTPGDILAENVRECIGILNEINPGGDIYVWSDMFDPHHNARKDYYLVQGTLEGSWKGLDPRVIIVPWHFANRKESLAWFSGRGHRQVIAGYYDADPARIRQWLEAASQVEGVQGVMYTTWRRNYRDLEAFAEAIGPAR